MQRHKFGRELKVEAVRLVRERGFTLEVEFRAEALGEALAQYDKPEICNTAQRPHFAGRASTLLREAEIAISMDGRGASRDNVLVERL